RSSTSISTSTHCCCCCAASGVSSSVRKYTYDQRVQCTPTPPCLLPLLLSPFQQRSLCLCLCLCLCFCCRGSWWQRGLCLRVAHLRCHPVGSKRLRVDCRLRTLTTAGLAHRKRSPIRWRFTTKHARIKLRRLCPAIQT